MSNKICLFILCALTWRAQGQERIDFRVEPNGGPNLLRESEKLQLRTEPTFKSETRPHQKTYGLGLGVMNAGFVAVETDGVITSYDLEHGQPMLRLSYSVLPWNGQGQFGWSAALAYGWQDEKVGGQRISLHVIPITTEMLYRGRLSSTQLVAPQLGLGVGHVASIQRGGRNLNSTESAWVGLGSLSLWWGVGEWLKPGSPTAMDVTFSWQRLVNLGEDRSDWSGNGWFVNLGTSL